MELFEIAFNKGSIYETLFFNIKSVAAYPTVMEFKENEPELFKQWEVIADVKYKVSKGATPKDAYMLILNDLYQMKAVYYPEFCKIVAITYATVKAEDGKLNRNFNKIVDNDEINVLKAFQEVLSIISRDGEMSTPKYFPTLCGHNIINNDIPLFIKRLIKYKDSLELTNNLIPLILKNHLKAKPWDANVVDTVNLWKFNGISNTPLSMICDFIGLKRNVDLMEMDALSKYYWENIKEKEEETLKFISHQSANQTNLVIQLINTIRLI